MSAALLAMDTVVTSGTTKLVVSVAGHPFRIGLWQMFGLLGQALFTARVLLQWYASEKAKRTVVPLGFWWLSVCGALVAITYAYGKTDVDVPYMLGSAISLVPYTRNLFIAYRPGRPPRPASVILPAAAILGGMLLLTFAFGRNVIHDGWFYFGLVANMTFSSRFLFQWAQSEKLRESVMTRRFWYLTLVGSLLVFTYGAARGDVVLVVGSMFAGVPAIRNLMIIRKNNTSQGDAAEASAEG